ncbi:MAG: M23 family metallopeptidase [Bryobacteraceae bacterium]|jgi:peptidoglycan LD-endopeptidase LytH
MRKSLVTVFFAGFVFGLVFLAVLLRQMGILRTVNASAAPPVFRTQPAEASHTTLRSLPEQRLTERRLIIPVQGVHAEDLPDDFNQIRGGHRHEAIDIMAPRGTPVLAADNGSVVKLFLSKPGGLTVYQFDESQTYCYYYAHLNSYAPRLQEGMPLRKGDVLGYVGSSGNASPDAPHLHFAVFQLGPERRWWEGTPIDPYGFFTGSPSK